MQSKCSYTSALYKAVIEGMLFSEFIRLVLGGTLGIALAIGFSQSIQVRCISLLVIPHFFAKEGRAFVSTYAIAFLILGPITNIMLNAEEVTRVISCTTELMVNHSMQKADLRYAPIREVLSDLTREGKGMNKLTRELKVAFRPIEREVEDDSEINKIKKNTQYVDSMDDGKHEKRSNSIERKYKVNSYDDKGKKKGKLYNKKLDYRCEDVYNMGVIVCRRTFAEIHKRCMDKLSFLGYFMCLPFKLTVICELIRWMPGLASSCNSKQPVNNGFGESYETAEAANGEFDKNFEANVQYKMEKKQEELDVKTGTDLSKGIRYEFALRKKWFDFFTLFLRRILAFLFIRVFISAHKYHKSYLSNFRYDNIYLSGYFKRIDARRHKQDKRVLFPLKKIEAKERINPSVPKLTGPEKSKWVKGTFKLLLNLITCAVIVFVDYIIYEILDIIRRNSYIEYHQRGHHHIGVIIYGNGIMGHLVRTLMNAFNKKHTLDNISTNTDCLPRPVKMPVEYIWKILGVYGIVWALMYFEAFGLRMRRIIAAVFYRKREKKRVLYLYNDMLKKRKGFLRIMRHKIRSLARQQKLSMATSLLTSLRYQYPKLCCCLKMAGLGKKKCLICNEGENKNTHHCTTPSCNFVYCKECWRDVKKMCYACLPATEFDSESEMTDMDIW